MTRLRAFIACRIALTPPLATLIGTLADRGPMIRTVDPHSLHVTLRFFGDIDEAQTQPVADALRRACAGVGAFDTTCLGLNAFPTHHRPATIWVGLTAPQLPTLASRINANLNQLGFPPADHPFTPHLTIARIKSKPPPIVFDLLSRHARTDFGSSRVTHAHLFRSNRHPGGAQHIQLATIAL